MSGTDPQRPIRFGGVELPPVVWKGAVGYAAGAPRTLQDEVDEHVREWRRLQVQPSAFKAHEEYLGVHAHANPPAGEATPEARLVNVSRMALAARIKHGVPLVDMLSHFQTLALVEEHLISYR